jgi:hypothetical protein
MSTNVTRIIKERDLTLFEYLSRCVALCVRERSADERALIRAHDDLAEHIKIVRANNLVLDAIHATKELG